MEPAAGDIWMYRNFSSGEVKNLYYLLLECKPMPRDTGWEVLLLALNREACDENYDGDNRIPYDWYRDNMFWEKVA
jgi:hypothetical protein